MTTDDKRSPPHKPTSDPERPSPYPPWQSSQFGRPTVYKPAYADLPVRLGRVGKCTYAHLAAELGVGKSTIRDWANAHDDFAHGLKVGQAADEAYWDDFYAQQEREKGIKMAQGFGVFRMKQKGWTDQVDHRHRGNVQVIVNSGVQAPQQVEHRETEAIEADYERLSD